MKKNIKHLFIAAAFVATSSLIVIACSDNNESNDSVKFNTKSLQAAPAYLNQTAFVTGGDSEGDADFIVNNNLYKNMENPNVSWTYFDNLYSPSLQSSIKQELSYIILCKKDLIGLVKNNPGNAALVAALKKHVDNLVGTNYLGYTALYYALDALRLTGNQTAYVKGRAAQIVQYAANDPFHPDMIQSGVAGVGSQDLYDRFVDNYDHVSKIAALQ